MNVEAQIRVYIRYTLRVTAPVAKLFHLLEVVRYSYHKYECQLNVCRRGHGFEERLDNAFP
jgi:hypothetical protein